VYCVDEEEVEDGELVLVDVVVPVFWKKAAGELPEMVYVAAKTLEAPRKKTKIVPKVTEGKPITQANLYNIAILSKIVETILIF